MQAETTNSRSEFGWGRDESAHRAIRKRLQHWNGRACEFIPFQMDHKSDALLIVDVQNDFCPGGALEVPHGDEVVGVINRLAEVFDHLLLTQDWHPRGHISFASSHPGRCLFEAISLDYGEQILWPDHCMQDTAGAGFHRDLNVRKAELVLRKGFRREIDSYSALYENDHVTATGLAGYLRERGITGLFIAGLAFDFCVRYSAEDARRCGFSVSVIEDACRGIDVNGSIAETHARLSSLGIGALTSTELK